MAKIIREPKGAARETYDLIIIGGGIYGAMLSLESTRRGLRSLLIEKGDFGGATSFNTLRILHGGLRDLQRLDISRLREFVRERRWFLKTFPGLVKPLPCLMPLYANGLRRPVIFSMALFANDLLSRSRNEGLLPDYQIPAGQVIGPERTKELFPSVDVKGLKGGAVWYDAIMLNPQRLLMEILRWSCGGGATTLNYVKALELLENRTGVAGVAAIDQMTGHTYEFRGKIVINATGPWCRQLASRFDRDNPRLFKGSIAWNILLDRKPLSSHTLAINRNRPGGQTYFLLPHHNKLLVGTGHAPWGDCENHPAPSSEQLEAFVKDLNVAIPSLEITQDDILQVFAGLLPVKEEGTVSLCTRPVICDHSREGGPRGLHSISGVKYTTSRIVAQKVLDMIYPELTTPSAVFKQEFEPPRDALDGRGLFSSSWNLSSNNAQWKKDLQLLIEDESVKHLDDLVLRRTNLADNPIRALQIAPLISELFSWSNLRKEKEIKRLVNVLGNGGFQDGK